MGADIALCKLLKPTEELKAAFEKDNKAFGYFCKIKSFDERYLDEDEKDDMLFYYNFKDKFSCELAFEVYVDKNSLIKQYGVTDKDINNEVLSQWEDFDINNVEELNNLISELEQDNYTLFYYSDYNDIYKKVSKLKDDDQFYLATLQFKSVDPETKETKQIAILMFDYEADNLPSIVVKDEYFIYQNISDISLRDFIFNDDWDIKTKILFDQNSFKVVKEAKKRYEEETGDKYHCFLDDMDELPEDHFLLFC